jgi:site-specific recombinase XerD
MTPNELVINNHQLPAELLEVGERARDYIQNSKSANTRRAYKSDWEHFSSWCEEKGLTPLPAGPKTVTLYLSDLAGMGRKASTIGRHLTAISQAHEAAGQDNPLHSSLVKYTMQGIKRTLGTAPGQKKAAVTDDIRAMVDSLPDNLLGIRDKAIILLGFAGAFRRSELVGLNVEDIEFHTQGMTVTLRHSKTDQEGEGYRKGIPYGKSKTCPVLALKTWLDASGINEGPIFRGMNRHGQVLPGRLTDQVIAKVVKRTAEAAGLDPKKYAGHSLRAGLATAAASAGVQERDIMKQTGHRSVQMVRRYIQEGELFKDNAAGAIGL